MSKVVSFRDLRLAEELSHIKNEIELLDPANDDLVASVLKELGFDIDYGVAYVPSKHRDMQGKVAVGFQAVGEVTVNRKYINSPVCDIVDRMVATAYTDRSLAREMTQLSAGQVNYKSLVDDSDYSEEDTEFPNEEIEPDYEFVTQQIKQLEAVRDAIRGSMFNEAGDIKTFDEYKVK